MRSTSFLRLPCLFLLALTALTPSLRANAQTNQTVYDNALASGWQNWSWCIVNFAATSPVHSGLHSIQITYTAAWQGFYLHESAANTTGLTSITFWINGGSVNGRKINIAGIRNNNAQPGVSLNSYISGGSVAANTWRSVTVPLSALGVANVSDFTGFWLQEAGGSAQSTFYVDDIALAGTPITNGPVAVMVDAGANRHAINPNIYGVAYGSTQQLLDLNCPLNRMGGNNTTRYNWQLNADNRASDWYFESIGDTNATAGYRGDQFILGNENAGAQSMLTIPMIGWVAKLGPSRSKLSSFSIKKYGAQTGHDGFMPDAGNGISNSTKQPITGNDPNDANVPVDSTFQAGWINHLISTWGTAANGGLKYYILDNEPSIWHGTHRDVHPVGETMNEELTKIEDYASKVKAADPTTLVVGPEEWGWSGYFYSGYDQQYGNQHGWSYLPDRASHGNADYLPWLLSQLHQYDVAHNTKSLDVFTVHYYPQSGEFSTSTSTNIQLLRNRSTRSLWDPNYVDQSWIGSVVQLIPRLRTWVAQNYPGLQTGITEYSWGADGYIGGATAQADIWGIFGREGLDLATRWTVPSTGGPVYNAMKLIRNYDGAKSSFGDVSVSDSTANPDNLSSFAAQRTSDGALTVLVVNKALSGSTPVTVNIANFNAAATAQVYQLTATNSISRLADLAVSNGSVNFTAPMQSITLLVLPAGTAQHTLPVYQINCGGGAVGAFSADTFYSGGVSYPTTNSVSTAGVANAAPAAVYQSVRGNNFTYTIPGLTAGASYTVRLHFAELWYGLNGRQGPGQRLFNVTINSNPVLSNFDVYATAGGPNLAVVKQAVVTANSQGQLVLAFTPSTNSPDQHAIVSGIEVLQ